MTSTIHKDLAREDVSPFIAPRETPLAQQAVSRTARRNQREAVSKNSIVCVADTITDARYLFTLPAARSSPPCARDAQDRAARAHKHVGSAVSLLYKIPPAPNSQGTGWQERLSPPDAEQKPPTATLGARALSTYGVPPSRLSTD